MDKHFRRGGKSQRSQSLSQISTASSELPEDVDTQQAPPMSKGTTPMLRGTTLDAYPNSITGKRGSRERGFGNRKKQKKFKEKDLRVCTRTEKHTHGSFNTLVALSPLSLSGIERKLRKGN